MIKQTGKGFVRADEGFAEAIDTQEEIAAIVAEIESRKEEVGSEVLRQALIELVRAGLIVGRIRNDQLEFQAVGEGEAVQ